MHPNYFDCAHLPKDLARVSRPFGMVARMIVKNETINWQTLAEHTTKHTRVCEQQRKCLQKILHIAGTSRLDDCNRQHMLQVLLEAKDCAVRAALPAPSTPCYELRSPVKGTEAGLNEDALVGLLDGIMLKAHAYAAREPDVLSWRLQEALMQLRNHEPLQRLLS